MIYEVEIPNAINLLRSIFYKSSPIYFPGNFLNTATGRSATHLVLNYLKKTGIIEDKNSTVIVPKWMCISYLQLLRKHCSPILKIDKSAKAALIFHQYGFPQNMDEIMDFCDSKKITVIEDCAHLFEGCFHGRRLGTFGLAGIFSFSKLFPSVWGGGLATQNEELFEFAKQKQNNIHSWWISYMLHLTKFKADQYKEKNKTFWHNANVMSYGCAEYAQKINPMSLNTIIHEISIGSLKKRKQNYVFVLDYFKNTDFFSTLEKKEVTPYVVPLIASLDRLRKMEFVLKQNKINTGLYNFDVNRNLFNPQYKQCIWVPIHPGINTGQMEKICDIISRTL